MLSEQLERAWRQRRQSAPIEAEVRFAEEGLLLGAGTLLASSGAESSAPDARMTVLMTAAHLKAPSATALAHLRKAAQRWREGDDALASMHLALSGLGRLRWPEADARRLFFADTLLDAGVAADDLLKALTAAPIADSLARYSPDQPRVPAGSGRASGQ